LQDDDDAPGPLQKIRASICEIAELYAQKYLDAFPQLGGFVNGVWNMLTTVGPGTREDVVSSIGRVKLNRVQACFPSTAISIGGRQDGASSGHVFSSGYTARILRKDYITEYEHTS